MAAVLREPARGLWFAAREDDAATASLPVSAGDAWQAASSLALESAGNAWTFTILDTNDLIPASIEAEITRCAEYVIDLIGRYIAWQGTLDFVVEIRPAAESPYPTADGILPSYGQLGWNGSAWVNQTIEECITGIDSNPGRPDAGCTIYLAADGTIRNYGAPVWFDPAPAFGVDPAVPSGVHDFVGIYTHEVFHSLGFWPGTQQWDQNVVTIGGASYFTGAAATALLGSRIELEAGTSHYRAVEDGSIAVTRGLMYEFGNYDRNRWDIGRIDLAMLSDLGHTIRSFDGLSLFEMIDHATDLTGTAANDTLYGDYHANRLIGGAGDDTLVGGAGTDSLEGGNGNDMLDGGAGNDAMSGGAGNDHYIVGEAGDLVAEAAGGGLDRVHSAISYVLRAEFEYLTLTGTAAISGTGNALANQIAGNDAANRIDGGAGADLMAGGLGNDTYVVDNAGDRVVETSALGGRDLVNSAVSFTLGAYVENLTLTGTAALAGTGNALANVIVGNSAANVLRGMAGNDTLSGLDGNDSLDGGTGADTMSGGNGNDTYVVGDLGDRAVESSASGGVDLVKAGVTFTLGAHVEKLTLTGAAAIGGTGNSLANVIVGNSAANVLRGMAGNDTLSGLDGNDSLDGGGGVDIMSGGNGNDTYVVGDLGDRAVESSASGGVDLVKAGVTFTLGAHVEKLTLTGAAAIGGTGNSLANVIVGNSAANVLRGMAGDDTLSGLDGNDSLDGGGGVDTMSGGNGNDTYVVGDVGDRAVESSAAGGVDLVKASVSFTLASYVEKLTLTGVAAVNGTGNTLANTITGNSAANALNGMAGNDTLSGLAGHDRLDGGTGADYMLGGNGDDVYFVDNAGDRAVEQTAGGGVDIVHARVGFTLATYVENLTLAGTLAIDGTGNALANTLRGNGAANTLSGLSGNDSLYGGGGADRLSGGAGMDGFFFDTALSAGNVDTILDFNAADDTIGLDRTVFAGIAANGTLSASAFCAGSIAQDIDDRILYDAATGRIFYDADGSGAGTALLFAQLNPGTALSHVDFSAYLPA